MKTNLLKVGTRVAATLVGVVGLSLIVFSLLMLMRSYSYLRESVGGAFIGALFLMVIDTIGLLFGVYFLEACHSTWFRFSPKAVRQLCTSLAWCLWAVTQPSGDLTEKPPWVLFVWLFWGVAVFWLNLFARDALTTALFGRQTQPA